MNYSLKSGIVVNIYYPDDSNNVSKNQIEYDVAALEISTASTNYTIYRNCLVTNPFGTVNNNVTYTLQIEEDITNSKGQGANVLLLCMNGRSEAGSAAIIGGISRPGGPQYSSEDGQFYDFNFNGINYNIDKDGELTITFNSPIDYQGNKANEKAAGTVLKIDKEGRYTISDNEGQSFGLDRVAKTATWTDGNDSIVIDKGNKKITMTSSGDLDANSQGKTDVSSQGDMSLESQADLSLSAASNASFSSQGNMATTSGGSWNVKVSGNGMINVQGNVMIQANNQAQIMGATTAIGAGGVPIAGVGISQTVGITGAPGSPMTTLIISGSATCSVGT
jgi:hypothetical protein